jgi:hypothetical protein
MAAGSTYTPIATTTLGSTAASYTFSSIPSTYTDLILVVRAALNAAGDIYVQFNGDTATNYSITTLYGTGSAAGSTRFSSQTQALIAYYGNLTSTLGNTNQIMQVQNYANSTTYKTFLSRGNNAGSGLDANVGLWRSTSAINSIKLNNSASTFSVGSTFTLYGIAAA